jgi:hypothetical protein
MATRSYMLEDGSTIEVCVELGQWSAWLKNEPRSQVIGFPLEGVLMEVIGLNPAHDDVPVWLSRLAVRIQHDVPSSVWPSGPLTI